MKYMITLDIDGTTVNHKGEISPLTQHVIQQIITQGHVVVLATGRPLSGALSIYNALNLKTPIVTDNGACIDHPNDLLFIKQRTYMPLEIMHQLFLKAKPWLKTAFFNIEEKVYAYQYDEKLEKIFSGLSQNIVIEKDFNEINERPTGLIFLVEPYFKDQLESFIDLEYSDKIAYRLWGEDSLYAVYEIYTRHVSKASAIKQLLKQYQMKESQWISFGDGINDIEMISEAGRGIAMKNGMPELIDVCDEVTTHTNDEDGLARYLIDFFSLNS